MRRYNACSLREVGSPRRSDRPGTNQPQTPRRGVPTVGIERTQVVDFPDFSGYLSWVLRNPFAALLQFVKVQNRLMQLVDFHDSFRYSWALRCFQWSSEWRLGLVAALTYPEGIEAFSPALRGGTSYAEYESIRITTLNGLHPRCIKTCYSTLSG